jgi:hypothetical protein
LTGNHRKPREANLQDATETAVAWAMLWLIPVCAFLYAFLRL